MARAEETLSREDRFLRNKHRIVIAYVAAFGVWQVADLVGNATAGAGRSIAVALSVAASITWLVLLTIGIRADRVAKRDPVLRAAIEDERAQTVRLRAYRSGFAAAIASAALLGIPAATNVLPGYALAKLVVVIGVGTFLVSTVVLDRE